MTTAPVEQANLSRRIAHRGPCPRCGGRGAIRVHFDRDCTEGAAITTTGSARAVRGGSNAVASNTGPLFAERPPSRGTARSYPDTMGDLTACRLAPYQARGTVGKWQREEL